MKYTPDLETIPAEKRADINTKILALIDSGNLGDITAEDIYNAYTGDGGLHGLSRNDYNSYYDYSEAKKDVENGQFFTPPSICEIIAKIIGAQDSEMVCDPTCGKGDFFNYFKEQNCHGADLDFKAVKVSQFLYPEARIIQSNILGYELEHKMDYVVGNPPFNLAWSKKGIRYRSQDYFFIKSAELMKLGGIIGCVVPESFMKDPFSDKSSIEQVEENFSFIGQHKLANDLFKAIGVADYGTKIMFFQRRSEAVEFVPYSLEFCSIEELMERVKNLQAVRKSMAVKLRSEMLEKYDSSFTYKVSKYLYEIKTHKTLEDYRANSLAYVDKFYTQKCPDDMDYTDWEKTKITEKMVLGYLKRTIKKQVKKTPIDKVEVVKTQHGYKLKAYSPKENRKLNAPANSLKKKYISTYELVTGLADFSDFDISVKAGYRKLIERKRQEYRIQTASFESMSRDAQIDKDLKAFVFRNGSGARSKLNDIQREDLGLVLQKNYAMLNWQQGSGKTVAGFYWLTYRKQKQNFIVSTPLSINSTWKNFLTKHCVPYVIITKLKDFEKVDKNTVVMISFFHLKKYKKQLKVLCKKASNKINLLFDESDEITNHSSGNTKVMLDLFRRADRVLEATGTSTRNAISELYSQFELMFNNSYNFMNYCVSDFEERKNKDDGSIKVIEKENKYVNQPFRARGGNASFKRCFNPSKTTVFGKQRQDQDLYNGEYLLKIIGSTILTRKFKEVAGDKYDVESLVIKQHVGERHVYRKIIDHFSEISNRFFESTGSSKKDSILQIIRQIQLLIKATSMPQLFPEYSGGASNKTLKILELVEQNPDTKIAIGCTNLDAVDHYVRVLREKFPDREVFEVTGGDAVKKRGGITGDFEDTRNGILICTQMSLKSSINIPSCNLVVIESLQWNIPKIEQFYFRFIRYDSADRTRVVFLNYENTIEVNLLALLMAKERLNDFVKTREYKENSEVFDEFGIDMDILNQLMGRETDEKGKSKITMRDY